MRSERIWRARPRSSFCSSVRVKSIVGAPRLASGLFLFSSRRRHTRFDCDWSSDVCSSDLHWATALGALAGAEPDAPRSLAAALGESAHSPTRVDAARVYVVTAAMSAQLAERLLGLRSAQRDVAVVWVDAPDFAGNGADTAQ